MVPLHDLRYWGFFSLGLLSLLLFMGALAQWWLGRTMARGGERLTGAAPSSRPGQGLTDRLIRWLHVSPEVGQVLARLPGIERYDRLLQQTGWPLRSTVNVMVSPTLAAWSSLMPAITKPTSPARSVSRGSDLGVNTPSCSAP